MGYGLYISALEHVMMLILCTCVLLVFIIITYQAYTPYSKEEITKKSSQSKYGGMCDAYIGGDIIKPSKCVRDLGSYLDSNLSMDSHINMVIRSVYGQLRTIGKIRKFLDTDACAMAINSLATSRLDYNNALLFGVPEKSLCRLQIMQNQAARILAKVDCHEHITPVLVSLHWLPIRARIDYKILVLVYKCIHQEFGKVFEKDSKYLSAFESFAILGEWDLVVCSSCEQILWRSCLRSLRPELMELPSNSPQMC